MKKPFKVSSLVMSILAFVFIGAFLVCYCLFYFRAANNINDMLKALYEPYFAIPQFKTTPVDYFVCLIASYVVAALGIVLLVLSIFLEKGKRKAFGIIAGALLIAIAPHGTMGHSLNNESLNFWQLIVGKYSFINLLKNGDIEFGIYAIGMLLFFVLAVVFTVIAFAFGTNYSRYLVNEEREIQEVTQETIEEIPAVEEVPAEEAVVADQIPQQFEEFDAEPVPAFVAELEPEPVREEVKEEPAPQPEAPAEPKQDLESLAVMIRDIVRDEIARSMATKPEGQPANDSHTDNHSIVGATFGGPLVVQYFNGGINGVTPAPVPAQPIAPVEPPKAVEEKPAEVAAPVEEKPAPQPEPEPAPAPAAADVAAPVVVAPVPAPVVEEKKPVVRVPFQERLIDADKEMKNNYNEIKNEILSYGVKSRVSNSGDTFRLHCKTYVKLTIAGKSLKLYFALNPEDYADSTIPVQDASNKSVYADIPLVFKVKSALSLRRCKELIAAAMEKDNLEQGEIGTVNWVKELKATYVPNAKEPKDCDDDE